MQFLKEGRKLYYKLNLSQSYDLVYLILRVPDTSNMSVTRRTKVQLEHDKCNKSETRTTIAKTSENILSDLDISYTANEILQGEIRHNTL